MEHDHQPDLLRELVLRTFRDLGASEAQLKQMSDTLLIRDGFYRGRSFRAGGMMAMWMAGLVQFYGPEGEMLRTVLLGATSEPQSKAA